MRVLFVILFLINTTSIFATTWYVNVNASGDNDGASWQNAFISPQLAFDTAFSGDTIWISQGIYTPISQPLSTNIPNDSVHYAFWFANKSLSIFGGFTGGETSLNQRNYRQNLTILSGNIRNKNDKTDNTNMVVNIQNVADLLIDGIVIEDSYGSGSNMDLNSGFRILNVANAFLRNCIVRNIETRTSAGSIVRNSNVRIENCEFYNNKSQEASAVYFLNSSAHVQNSTFHHNTASSHGGAITFNGGATLANPHVIVNSLFYNNQSDGTQYGGGAVHAYNVLSPIYIINSTFVNNKTNHFSGNDMNALLANYKIYNSILWSENGKKQVHIQNSSPLLMKNSIVSSDSIDSLNVNNIYPDFRDTLAFDFTLKQSSIGLNAGDTADISRFLPDIDLMGNNRIFEDIIDIGAFESFCLPIDVSLSINGNEISVGESSNGALYQWINCLNNDIIVGAESQIFTATESGDYACIVSNSCSIDTSACQNILISSLAKEGFNQVLIYPNPANQFLIIESKFAIEKLVIFDLNGKMVLSSNTQTKRIDLSALTKGIYLVSVQTSEGVINKKLLKN